MKLGKSYGIRWKMMLIVAMIILGLLAVMTYRQVESQHNTISQETERRMALTRRDLIQRANVLSENLQLQTNKALEAQDFEFVADLAVSMLEETSELTYVILMDKERYAYLHTMNPDLMGQTLAGPEDIYAQELNDYGVNEYKLQGEMMMEFIVPIGDEDDPWGFLRMGFSLARLNDIMIDAEADIEVKTLQILVESGELALWALLVSLLITYIFIFRSIKPLETLQETMNAIQTESDLSRRIDVVSRDEIGQTAATFNSMLDRFQEIVRDMATSADHLASATDKLFSTTDKNALQARKHSKDVKDMTTEIEDMNATISKVAQNAQSLAGRSMQTRKVAMGGGEILTKSAQAIAKLEEYSTHIDDIAVTITEIASKTEILAINTGIEAAKAGAYGRGFTVVAKEVKKLAEQTTKATNEITQMIHDIQSLSSDAGGAMIDSSKSMDDIITEATQMDDMVDKIAAAMQEQSGSMAKMLTSVHSVQDLAKGFSTEADKTKSVAGEINNLSSRLYKVVERFKID